MTRKPFQSKLRPHLDFIRECRDREMSYPQISAELRTRFGLSAAPSTIFAFVKVRSRRRSVVTLLAPVTAGAAAAPADRRTPMPPARPTVKASSATGWLFYDPTKPLEKISP